MKEFNDEQRLLISRAEYKKYKVNGVCEIEYKGENIKIGTVSQVISKDSGEDTYVLTDIALPENPTAKDYAKVKEITILYQGSTLNTDDWVVTDFDIAAKLPDKYTDISYNTNGRETVTVKAKDPNTVEVPPQQLKDAAQTLDEIMEKYPNAKITIYGHSLGSMNAQYAMASTKYPERIAAAYLYNGPNIYRFLTPEQKEQVADLYFNIYNYVDIYDFVSMTGRGYNQMYAVGQVYLVDSKNLTLLHKIAQHLWGGYVFDKDGNLLDKTGAVIVPKSKVQRFDINDDEKEDLIFRVNGLHNDIFINMGLNGETELTRLHFTPQNLFSVTPGNLDWNGEPITVNFDDLLNLSNNLSQYMVFDLLVILTLCSLCIDKNQSVRIDFDTRKEEVSENIKELFKEEGMPFILDSIEDSLGVIIENRYVYEKLSAITYVNIGVFEANQVASVNGNTQYYDIYNTYLELLAINGKELSEFCNVEKSVGTSTVFGGRPEVIRAWGTVENATLELLSSSDQTFEGDGLRTGKEDGIAQAVESVLSVEQNNILELQKVLMNTISLIGSVATNFYNEDIHLGRSIRMGEDIKFEAPLATIPQNYEAYLSRDGKLDDVKDVLQAFDLQVEKNSKDYAKKVAEVYENSLGTLETNLEKWLNVAKKFNTAVKDVHETFDYTVMVKESYQVTHYDECGSYTVTNYYDYKWGNLEDLYDPNIVDGISKAVSTVRSAMNRIDTAIETSKKIKGKMNQIEPDLKKIIELGVYKAFELDDIVRTQQVILQLIDKCKNEIIFVRSSIENSMHGKAVSTMIRKLMEIYKLMDYFSTFVSDCFGENITSDPEAAKQSNDIVFSIN